MKRGAPKDEGSLSDGDDPGRSSPRSRSSRSSESSNPPTPPSSNSPSNSSFPSPRPNNEKRRGRSGVDRPQQRPSLPHRRRALSGEHHQTTNQPAKKGRRNILKQLGTFVKKMKKKVVRREEGVKRESLDSLTSIESYSSVALLRERLDDVGELASRYKVQGMMAKVRSAIGASDLMRELRLKREEYARKMEDLLVARRSNRMEQDHPYVALRKKIEAMALAEGASYSIEYKAFSNRALVRDVGIPLYASDYDNERKKQARRRQFMFGLRKDDRYDFDAEQIDEYADDSKHHSDQTWASNKNETQLTILATVFSAANLIRFPQACYINGGIVFFFVYCLLIVTLIQPLVLFEMLIGQFSFKGEWGFSHLHKCARGFSYAILFVNMTFITLQSTMAGYTGLYAVGALLSSPGECDAVWGNLSRCVPYSVVESWSSKVVLTKRSAWLEQHFTTDRETLYNANVYLSTEMFFRFYIYNWKSKTFKDPFHWRFVLAFFVILVCIVPSSIQTYLASAVSRLWIQLACFLPILLTFVLCHQYFFRGGRQIPAYFSKFKWERMSTLVFWCDAFEMAITTVGVGFGGLVRVSGRNDFKYHKLKRLSWLMSIAVMAFCLLSALVVFTELGILGRIMNTQEYIHIIAGGFGVSFVCLSGALLKIGPAWILASTFAWITLINVWPLIVSAQMGVSYLRHWIPIKNPKLLKLTSVAVGISLQLVVVSVYIIHADFAENDSYDLFGGSGAACVILAVEMGIAFVLCGFREFMTDIEIMLDTPMSFTFQVQMRYYAPYAIGIAYFVIAVSWFFNPPRYKRSVHGVQALSPSTFWIGFVLNAIPILILVVFGYWGFHSSKNKVVPINETSKIAEKRKGVKLFWNTQARWLGRRAAVSAVHTAAAPHLSIFSIYQHGELEHRLVQRDLKEAYWAHVELRDKLRTWYRSLKVRVKWITLLDKILANLPLKSIVNATRVVLRHKELQTASSELSFLRRLIHQSSVLDLGNGTQERMLGKEQVDQQVFLLDYLIDNTSLYSGTSSQSESLSSEDEDDSQSSDNAELSAVESTSELDNLVHSTSTMESGNTSVYRRVVGKPKKSDQEVRLEFSTRIRRGIDLPYESTLDELKKLREWRFRKEREIIQRFDGPPQEHFITVRIARKEEEPFMVGFRVIILPHDDHFVTKRLPTPKPPIVHTTRNHLDRHFKADSLNQQIFELAIFTLKQRLWKTELSTLLRPSNRISLLQNINDEFYHFIEADKTCIVVLEDDYVANLRKDKWRWITPTLRRKPPLPDDDPPHEFTFNYEEVTVVELMRRDREQEKKDALFNEPSDILYHPSGQAFHPGAFSLNVPTRSTADTRRSSGSNSPTESSQLLDENKMLQVFGGHTGTGNVDRRKESDIHVPHLSWGRRKAKFQVPVVLIHERGRPMTKSSNKFVVRDLSLDEEGEAASLGGAHETEDSLFKHTPHSQGWDYLQTKSANRSIFLPPDNTRGIVDFSNLRNDHPNYWYYSDGKTLVVLKRSDDKVATESMASLVLSLATSSSRRRSSTLSARSKSRASKSKKRIKKSRSKSKFR